MPATVTLNRMPSGTVKWFDPRQGHGYIIPDEGGPELFLHLSQWLPAVPPQDGQPVEFQVIESPRGPIAVKVRLRDHAPA